MGNAQKRGLKYEHDLAADIYNETHSDVKVYRCGFSGNGRIPQPDLLITIPIGNIALEVKKCTTERIYIDQEDLEQLEQCMDRFTEVALVVKFTHREPIVIEYAGEQTWVPRGGIDLHYTASGNMRVDKPSTDTWPSSRSGRSDHRTIIEELAIK